MNIVQAWAARPKTGKKMAPEVSDSLETEDDFIGKQLTPELFRESLSHLGYDFEVFVDKTGNIWRFRRIAGADNMIPDGSEGNSGATW